VRNQVVHLINADSIWFSELQREEFPGEYPAADIDDRQGIRLHWDRLEKNMREHLSTRGVERTGILTTCFYKAFGVN
jgi:hypothetical protein